MEFGFKVFGVRSRLRGLNFKVLGMRPFEQAWRGPPNTQSQLHVLPACRPRVCLLESLAEPPGCFAPVTCIAQLINKQPCYCCQMFSGFPRKPCGIVFVGPSMFMYVPMKYACKYDVECEDYELSYCTSGMSCQSWHDCSVLGLRCIWGSGSGVSGFS